MTKRLLSALLALAALFAAAPTPCAAAEEEMTEAEAREARELTLRFMRRLREADDFAPLVGEFFPADFGRRLRLAVAAAPREKDDDFLIFFDRGLLLRVGDADLRRLYVAVMNFWNQRERLSNAAFDHADLQCGIAGRQRPCGWGEHFRLMREAGPAEALEIAQGDPLVESLLRNVGGRDEAAGAPSAADDERARREAEAMAEATKIRDAARLRAFTDGLERCVPHLRAAVARLRSEAGSLAAAYGEEGWLRAASATRDELRVYHLSDETLEEDTIGVPAGSLLVRARVYPFELAIARDAGRLRILVAYPDLDGD